MMHVLQFVCSHPLTRHRKLKAFCRVLNWQLRSRLNSEIRVPWIAGTYLVVKRGMTGATGNIYAGLHEFAEMGFLLHMLRKGDLFVDIGANTGTFTILASAVCKARSICFEPASETAANLQKNIRENALQDRVIVHEAVVGANQDTVLFTVGLDATNRVAKPHDQNTRRVSQVRLDDILAGETPRLIKVDVEGYEEEVLKGADRILSGESLLAIELETVSESTAEKLRGHGFTRMYYDPFRRLLTDNPNELPAINALFIRDLAIVRNRIRSAGRVRVFDSVI